MRKFIDIPNKPRTLKAMRQYLADHFRYTPGFGGGGIAQNVKIWNLNLSHTEREACLDALSDEYIYQASGAMEALREFELQQPFYKIYMEGRSNGYFTLHRTSGTIQPGPEWADMADWENTSGDVRYLFNLVWAFDQACNEAVAAFVDYALSLKSEAEPG